MELGYALSSEEHEPNQLVAQARRAEEAGVPAPYLERIHAYEAAGYDHLYIHQVGPDQDGFLRFYQREIRPALSPVHASQAP
jgi:2-methylisocitrate lyase-like PEP mutase family enzyme